MLLPSIKAMAVFPVVFLVLGVALMNNNGSRHFLLQRIYTYDGKH